MQQNILVAMKMDREDKRQKLHEKHGEWTKIDMETYGLPVICLLLLLLSGTTITLQLLPEAGMKYPPTLFAYPCGCGNPTLFEQFL